MATRRAMPIIDVRDVLASAEFYGRLGFATNGIWGKPAGFAIVQRGQVTIGLARAENTAAMAVSQGWAAYIYVDDAEALHAEFASAGITTSPIRQQDYGCADFDLRDPDGHIMCFGQDLDPSDGPGLSNQTGKG